jgi:hypothetical protein
MKTIFTVILLIVSIASAYTQTKPLVSPKDGASDNGIIIKKESFFIKKIFPNPVNDIATVDIKAVSSGNLQCNLYNILGTEVKKFDPVFLSQGDQQILLDFSILKPGIYILKVNMLDQVFSKVVKKT